MANSPLTFEAVQLFLALMRTGSLSKSASLCGITVTAASRLRTKLEEHFEEPLFVRTYEGMIPTPRAQTLVDAMERIAQAYNDLNHTKTFNPEKLERTFTIATTDNGVLCILIPVIQKIRRVAPAVKFRFRPIESDILDRLKTGNVDLALYPLIDLPPKYHSLDLFRLDRACLVRKGHPLAKKFHAGCELTEKDFNSYEKIAVGLNDETQNRAIYGANTTLAANQRTGIQVPYFMAAPFFLDSTDYTLFLPEPTARFFAEILDLELLNLPSDQVKYSTRIVWHDRLNGDVESQWLRSIFVAYARPIAGDASFAEEDF